jgi:DNA-binding NtrC family response regulator
MTGPAVLAIEDEPLILALMEDALAEGGFSVTACAHPMDALRHIDEQRVQFAALVTDIKFVGEEVSGWDIARHAREVFATIGVVYTSGDSGGDWRSHGVPESTFVQKPFAAAQIVTAVSNVINASGTELG